MADEDNGKAKDLLDWLGARSLPDFARARWLGAGVGLLLLGLFLLAFGAAGLVLIHTIGQAMNPDAEGPNLGAGALIAALLGAPFLIWATMIKQRTLALSETALFNDRLNAAVEALYSRRQVTRATTANGEEKILTEWEDDIVQRSAAVDRLEGLANERANEASRIASMLSVYVRELSRQFPAKESPRSLWLELVEAQEGSPPMGEEEALYKLNFHPDDVTVDALKSWAGHLRPFRTDVEKATQALGRLTSRQQQWPDIPLDLRDANLQGFNLSSLEFSNANLSGARMEGASLGGTRLRGANLTKASIEGADLSQAIMDWAQLSGTRMAGAVLTCAHLKRADLSDAIAEGATLTRARMQGANLFRARLAGAHLAGAHLNDALLSMSRLEGATLTGARLEGANLSGARMDRTNLTWARVNSATILTAAGLRGSAVKLVDFSETPISSDQLASLFGDGSTILAQGMIRPSNWPSARLRWVDFIEEWGRWSSDPAGYMPPPPPKVD
jgi:uncharacterized protein YjbI with pentapeptide repeats